MNTQNIEKLTALCCEKPFDTQKIAGFITTNKLSREEVTRAAIKTLEYGEFDYTDFLCARDWTPEREPEPEELRTHNWEVLFDTLIENGLDGSLVFCEDDTDHKNVMKSLQWIDNGDLGVRILRKILQAGASPNIMINDIRFFEDVDSDLVIDIDLGLYTDKWREKLAFYFWLVMAGFGGYIKDHQCPVKMKDGLSPEIFREFERFDYTVTWIPGDWTMSIFYKDTGTEVATL